MPPVCLIRGFMRHLSRGRFMSIGFDQYSLFDCLSSFLRAKNIKIKLI